MASRGTFADDRDAQQDARARQQDQRDREQERRQVTADEREDLYRALKASPGGTVEQSRWLQVSS